MRRAAGARLGAASANVGRVVFLSAARNWRRNLLTTSPALATIALLLGATGVLAVLWTAVSNVLATESAAASVLHVYVADGAAPGAEAALEDRLRADPRVRSVSFVSPDQALQRARSRPGLALLVSGDGSDSFPAELDVTVAALGDVAGIADMVSGDPAVDRAFPTSYDGEAYHRLATLVRYGQAGAAALLALLTAIALAVSGNAVRASLLARREEVAIMWLVGSPGWAMRAPFLVEGSLTGMVAGVIAGGVIAGAIAATAHAQPVLEAQFLPGVTPTFGYALGLVTVFLGAGVGMASTLAGLRGLRR